MTERGVPSDGLKAVGYGEAQPVADNKTAQGRAQNRRISFDWQAR
jgi:outer membrane protein OmpA-like peptidoglycan-associated protein